MRGLVFQEMTNHHNQKDGFSETRKLDPYWKSRPVACMVKHGVEIRIWSLSEDNTQSWVRISHGSNKFVIDSNYNDTESAQDLLEKRVTIDCEGFCSQIKGKSNTTKKRTY